MLENMSSWNLLGFLISFNNTNFLIMYKVDKLYFVSGFITYFYNLDEFNRIRKTEGGY